MFAMETSGTAVLAQAPRYLDAGKSQPPFDVSRHAVPIEDISSGGPPRDGIPSLTQPNFVSAPEANKTLKRHDRILGIDYNGISKAYPVRILNWHETVNDDFNGKPVLVTWCPLCLSGVAFDAKMGGKRLSFGVSGRLYKSNLLMYDHETGSLWSQILGEAITGPLTGSTLTILPIEYTSWEEWRTRHPDTQVLSFETGYKRDYALDPYERYLERGDPTFYRDSTKTAAKIRPMEHVLGVSVAGTHKVYTFSALKKTAGQFSDVVRDRKLVIHFDRKSQAAWVTTETGEVMPSIVVFWFAWEGFHRDTLVWR